MERNVIRADIMVAPFSFIDEIIRENRWQFLYSCSNPVHTHLVNDFYAYIEIVPDAEDWLTLQTTVRGVSIRVDVELISNFIGVPQTTYRGTLSKFCGSPLHGRNDVLLCSQ
jgi:hypothetical protein